MKPEYLKLSGGQKFRVEANWNSMVDYCDRKGYTTLSHLKKIEDIELKDVGTLIYSCVKEGERIDGRDFDLTETDFVTMLRPSDIGQFMSKYIAQTVHGLSEKEKSGKKKILQKLRI